MVMKFETGWVFYEKRNAWKIWMSASSILSYGCKSLNVLNEIFIKWTWIPKLEDFLYGCNKWFVIYCRFLCVKTKYIFRHPSTYWIDMTLVHFLSCCSSSLPKCLYRLVNKVLVYFVWSLSSLQLCLNFT